MTALWKKGKNCHFIKHALSETEALAVRCALSAESMVIADLQAEASRYFTQEITSIEGELPRSLIYKPLRLEAKTLGVITVQSFQPNAYGPNEEDILDTLASYIAIALDNAKAYGKLQEANDTIQEHNTKITDSILYAKTIQQAILPLPENFTKTFTDSFILGRAKDIVSGDFFWHYKKANWHYIAVVDCTGHGVPGAFMSLIGNKILNEIIEFYDVVEPAKILEHLNASIISALKQHEKANSDGMDVCLVLLKTTPDQKAEIIFAGAKRPLYYFRNGTLQKLAGTNKGIGGLFKSATRFEQEAIWLEKGDTLYLTSDGYVDQPDPERRKLGTPRFLELLEQINGLHMVEQKERLEFELDQHQSTTDQRDDITMVGIRI